MTRIHRYVLSLLVLTCAPSCASPGEETAYGREPVGPLYQRIAGDLQAGKPLVVTVDVVLCDNRDVNCGNDSSLGVGNQPATNLYWGALYGVKTMFRDAASGWTQELVQLPENESDPVVEVRVFSKRFAPSDGWRALGVERSIQVILVARAFRGSANRLALRSYFNDLTTGQASVWQLPAGEVRGGGAAHIVGFIGHNYLMNPINLMRARGLAGPSPHPKGTFVLACESEPYFGPLLRQENITRMVMTHEFMAPEAYLLLALLEGLGLGDAVPAIRDRVMADYAHYQRDNYPNPAASARAIFLPR